MAASVLDHNGKLHIVFVGWFYKAGAPDDVASEIFYTNNISGTFMEPESLPKAVLPFPPLFEADFYYSKEPTIAVDSNGTVHVAYYRTETQLDGSAWICYTNNSGGDFSTPHLLFYDPLHTDSKYYSYGNTIMLAANPNNDSIHIVFEGNSGTGNGGARYSAGLDGNFTMPVTYAQRSSKPTIKFDNDGIPNMVYWINSDTSSSSSNVNLVTSKILGETFSSPDILFASGSTFANESAFAIDQYDSLHVVFRNTNLSTQMQYVKGIAGTYSAATGLPTNTGVSLMYAINVGNDQTEYAAYKQAGSNQSLGFMYNNGSGFEDISPTDYDKYGITSAGPQWFTFDKTNGCANFVYTTGLIYLVSIDLFSPGHISPSNDTTIASITPTVTWRRAFSAASEYRLQVSTDSTFATVIVDDSTLTGTSKEIGPLDLVTTYYWRVGAGSSGEWTWSDPWHFTTASFYYHTLIDPDGDGGFESGATFAENGWTAVNGSQVNTWNIGTATSNGGSRAAYISNDNGVTHQYTTTTNAVVHVYRDIEFPTTDYTFTLIFDWKGYGQSGYDFMKIFLVDTATLPMAGAELSTGQIGEASYIGQFFYVTDTILINDNNAGTVKRLVFSWKNNNFAGSQPPAAIDNLSLTSESTTPVAVELLSFNGAICAAGVELTWTTATEINNYGFEVERKNANSSLWMKIHFLRGNGTSNVPHEYFCIDQPVEKGTYIYRLKQMDNDGSFNYSNSIEVDYGSTPALFSLAQNYPNPFNPTTVISYQLPVNSFVSLTVYDLLGREVALLVNGRQDAGTYTVRFSTRAYPLPSDVYFYKLLAGSFSDVKKMVILK